MKPGAYDTSDSTIGLCARCSHAQPVPHPRQGEPYVQCALSKDDQKYPRYPRLPVMSCDGFEEKKGPAA